MAYMARKTKKRQTAIVSLNDKNQEELNKIRRQKEEMISHYEQLKTGKWRIDDFSKRESTV